MVTNSLGVGAGWGGFRGAAAGDNWAKVVLEYKNKTSSGSEKDKRDCFFNMVFDVLVNEALVLLERNASGRICIGNGT
ncbi:hypothetical protein E2542_SST10132 [Spatholobus suberectus]|nr:hypothetical protein E2542_SST10132 [Spatholobus suberectus]